MTDQFWIKLNQLVKGYNFGKIENEEALMEFIKVRLEEETKIQRLYKAVDMDFKNYKNRVELKFKTFEMFLFFIQEALIKPVHIELTHRERDGINNLITAKIFQFKENGFFINNDEF